MSVTPCPGKRSRIMVFDTETNGLIAKSKVGGPPIPLDQQPHILQISFVIYDTATWKIVKSTDLYIKVDPSIAISAKITELTGITREICDTKGIPIEEAMHEFYKEYIECDCIVAHNLDFDREMILIEVQRILKNGGVEGEPNWYCVFNSLYEKVNNKMTFCTMKVGKAVCKIERITASGTYFKPPKLVELYNHFFGEGSAPSNLHNSLTDTYVCLRCFIKLKFGFEAKLDIFPNDALTPAPISSTLIPLI